MTQIKMIKFKHIFPQQALFCRLPADYLANRIVESLDLAVESPPDLFKPLAQCNHRVRQGSKRGLNMRNYSRNLFFYNLFPTNRKKNISSSNLGKLLEY
jgi:hypothetical protein